MSFLEDRLIGGYPGLFKMMIGIIYGKIVLVRKDLSISIR